MPRLSTLRTRALAELARQLRFESADAARRQLVRAEQLAVELLEGGAEKDPAPAFPEEWVVFRLTGLRTDAPLMGGEAVMLVREAVIADLGPLVERLSSAAGIAETNLPAKAGKGGALGGPWSDVAAVCDRWKVSRKTLERYRRKGLIGRRVRLGKGKERVVFSEDVLRLFERVHGLRVGGAAEFSRIPAVERAAMIERARAMRAEKGWTLDRCARMLAKEHGRVVETVRQMLRKHDERAVGGVEPIFAERGPLTGHERGLVANTALRGGRMTEAARRLGRTRGTTYRVLGDQRAARLRGLELDGPHAPEFERADAEKKFLGVKPSREGLGGTGDGARVIAEAATIGPVNAAEERARAAAYWYLRWRAARAIARLPRHGARAGEMDAIERDLLWASRLKAELVRSQLPLIVRTVESQTERVIGEMGETERAEVVRVGLAAVIEAVDQFDPFKGGRLAAPVGVALGRAVSAWMKARRGSVDMEVGAATGRARRMAPTAAPMDDWTRRVHAWQTWLDVDGSVLERLSGLDERVRRVVVARFGLADGGGGPPRTMGEAAAEIGTTATRAAAMLRRALAGR